LSTAARVARVRVPRRRLTVVDVPAALNLVGTLTKYLSLAALFPAAIALGYSEPVWPFLAAGGIAATVGLGLERVGRGRPRVGFREGFLVVALTWLVAAGFGALPYLFSGEDQLASPIDAYFESMAGFTTTGSSVLTDVEGLNHSLEMWRQFTQWLGGMGMIVLAIAVLPRLRVGGRQLIESEMPGPELEPLAMRIRDVARRLWLLYMALTALEVAVLAFFAWTGVDERMSFYQALAHAFSTMPTGGFSTQAESIAAFGAATQWAVALFMVLAGMNFALMYRALVRRSPGVLARDEELRAYFVFLAVGVGILAGELLGEGIFSGEAAVRHAVFQAVSIMTTTGFATANFAGWTSLALITLLVLMFVGGSAASTGGSVKVVRHVLVFKTVRRELDQALHPELVSPIRLNGISVDERTLRAVITFALLYIVVFALGAMGIAIESARTGAGLAPVDAAAAAATALGNVGPGFGIAGPFGSFAGLSDLSKAIMIALMWLGRLEIVPIVVLFTRAYWRA